MSDSYIEQLTCVLKAEGISLAFGVSGGGKSLDLISSLEDQGIRYFPVAHEASAALMSGACCRKGATTAVGITIKGPGVANLVSGILSNYYENRPALSISEAYGKNVPLYQQHKRLDHHSICSSILKGFAEAGASPGSLVELIRDACREIPGPVHFDLGPTENTQASKLIKREIKRHTKTTNVRSALSLIDSSKNPGIILGSMVTRNLSNVEWEKVGVPVVTTAAAKGAVDETSAFAGGIITGEINKLSAEVGILEHTDLIVAFGLRNTEVIKPVRFHAPLIILDVIDEKTHEGFEPEILIIDDNVQETTGDILEAVKKKGWGTEAVARHWQAVNTELMTGEWLPAAVFDCLQKCLGSGVILTLDTGLFCTIGETVWKCRNAEEFCSSSNGRFMGVSIPTAIGVAIASPGKKVLCVAGDGGIRPYFPEIKLAIQEKLPIIFALMADGSFGTVAMSGRGKKSSLHAFEIANCGWIRAADAMGCNAMTASNLIELQRGVSSWTGVEGPLFIEMSFNSEKYINSARRLR